MHQNSIDDDEPELHASVADVLEANGVLAKVKAQLRAAVYRILDSNQKDIHKTAHQSHIKKFKDVEGGLLLLSLAKELLLCLQCDYTAAVLDAEASLLSDKFGNRHQLTEMCQVTPDPGEPVLLKLLNDHCDHWTNAVNRITDLGVTFNSSRYGSVVNKSSKDLDVGGNRAAVGGYLSSSVTDQRKTSSGKAANELENGSLQNHLPHNNTSTSAPNESGPSALSSDYHDLFKPTVNSVKNRNDDQDAPSFSSGGDSSHSSSFSDGQKSKEDHLRGKISTRVPHSRLPPMTSVYNVSNRSFGFTQHGDAPSQTTANSNHSLANKDAAGLSTGPGLVNMLPSSKTTTFSKPTVSQQQKSSHSSSSSTSSVANGRGSGQPQLNNSGQESSKGDEHPERENEGKQSQDQSRDDEMDRDDGIDAEDDKDATLSASSISEEILELPSGVDDLLASFPSIDDRTEDKSITSGRSKIADYIESL